MRAPSRLAPLALALAPFACSPAEVDSLPTDDAGTGVPGDTGPLNPRPDGGTTPVVPRSDAGTVTNCPNGMVPGTWSRVATGTEADFVGLFGVSSDNLTAVADTAVRRWNGSAWGAGASPELMRTSGMNAMTLRLTAVGGFDPSTLFVAGIVGTNGGGEAPRGEMYRLGATATQVPLPGANLQVVSIRGSAANNVWAVGGRNAIQWDGTRFVDRSAGIPAGVELYDLWVFAPNEVWAVGTRVIRWDGSSWRDTGLAFSGAYFGVWGASPGEVYLVGNTVTRRWNGSAFTEVLTGVTTDLRAVWGSSARDVWVAGDNGAVAHFDGSAWALATSGVSTRLNRLWGASPNEVWAVGERGTALRYTFSGMPGTPSGMPCMMGNPNGLGDGMGTRVSAVNQSACARRGDGSVRCWGNNNGAQLGDGTTMTRLAPVAVEAIGSAVDVAISAFHGCAARTDGSVWCWASGRSGQLGNNTSLVTSNTPVRAGTLDDAVAVAVGASHSCALRRGGEALCWGANTTGQLGDGTNNQRNFPVPVAGATDYTQIVAGLNHTCARRSNGAVLCWGGGTLGQLGNGALENSTQAVAVQGLGDALRLGAGANHTCAVRANGAVVCWGANASGQLGDGTTMNRAAPVLVAGVTDAAAVGGGLAHTCAVRRGGQVLCWGANTAGQLGTGTTSNSLSPTAMRAVTDGAQVTGGADFTCVTRANGALVCVGGNANGQLGRGTMSARELDPAAPMGW